MSGKRSSINHVAPQQRIFAIAVPLTDGLLLMPILVCQIEIRQWAYYSLVRLQSTFVIKGSHADCHGVFFYLCSLSASVSPLSVPRKCSTEMEVFVRERLLDGRYGGLARLWGEQKVLCGNTMSLLPYLA
jgi:hypothetical protein